MTPLLPLALAAWTALPASGERPLRRFLLAAASDDGGPGRARLRFSSEDARGVAAVMGGLGGVEAANSSLLLGADSGQFLSALSDLSARMALSRDSGNRIELMVYYSGHSDEDGLILEGTRLSWSRLRRTLEASPAEVRLAVLDACASGAALRSKGGLRRQAFRIEGADRLRGQAFLTSSRAEEASQESDQLRGSFFTHAFLSGLRGAADADGDRKVTLLEAYRYAYDQTVAGTSTTRNGPQHPEFDLDLSGSGDVVLTDLAQAGSTLDLPSSLDGRIEVSDSSGLVLADLRKSRGRDVALGLPAGNWRVSVEDSVGIRVRHIDFPPGGRAVWESSASDSVLPLRVATPKPSLFGREDSLRALASHGSALDTIPLDIGFLPPWTTNGERAPKAYNRASLDLLLGEAAEIHGFQWAGAYALAGRSVNGWQASPGLARTGRLYGVQSGSAVLADSRVDGAQFGNVCAVARKDGAGAQFSGIAGWIGGDWKGAQASTVALSDGRLTGAQFGVFGYSRDIRGAQIAVVSISRGSVSGTQIGVLNIAESVSGAQVGVLNIARRASGNQTGVLNLADTADGVVLGVVNLARDMEALPIGVLSGGLNMRPGLETRLEESGWGLLGVRLDGRRFHVRLAYASQIDHPRRSLGYEIGFGAHWEPLPDWTVVLDYGGRDVWDLPPGEESRKATWNIATLGIRRTLGPVVLSAGTTWNILNTIDDAPPDRFVRLYRSYQWDPSRSVRMWPGAWLGAGITL